MSVPELARETTVVEPPVPIEKLRAEILATRDAIDDKYIHMARMLFFVRASEVYREWGYEDFDSYVLTELGFKGRKAAYLIAIFKTYVQELGRTEEELRSVGWSKAAVLANVVTSENADEWLERAKALTFVELVQEIRDARESEESAAAESGRPPAGERPSAWLRFGLFTEQNENVQQAISIAQAQTGSDKMGNLLDTICMEFVANHSPESIESDVNWWASAIKRRFGRDVILVDGSIPDSLRDAIRDMIADHFEVSGSVA